MGDNIRFNVLANVLFYFKLNDRKLSKRKSIKHQIWFLQWLWSFISPWCHLPKDCQKCNELKMRESNERCLDVCLYFCTRCSINWACKRMSRRSSQLYDSMKLYIVNMQKDFFTSLLKFSKYSRCGFYKNRYI